MEFWYEFAEPILLRPNQLWFNWHFEGEDRIPRSGPAIVVGNHISYFDQFVSGYAIARAGRRPRFLGKAELFDIPVVGTVFRGAGQIPVRRGTGDAAPLDAAQRALARGEVVVLYPEGTVTKDPDFLPMPGKTGAVRLSRMTGVPITPLASWGAQRVWQKSGKGSLRFGRPLWARIGPPIAPTSRSVDDAEDLRAATADLMAVLRDMVVDLRERYPARWARR
ncbi:MAG: lysophospholipid acyltransferase family protein [Actinomycetota bacterium]